MSSSPRIFWISSWVKRGPSDWSAASLPISISASGDSAGTDTAECARFSTLTGTCKSFEPSGFLGLEREYATRTVGSSPLWSAKGLMRRGSVHGGSCRRSGRRSKSSLSLRGATLNAVTLNSKWCCGRVAAGGGDGVTAATRGGFFRVWSGSVVKGRRTLPYVGWFRVQNPETPSPLSTLGHTSPSRGAMKSAPKSRRSPPNTIWNLCLNGTLEIVSSNSTSPRMTRGSPFGPHTFLDTWPLAQWNLTTASGGRSLRSSVPMRLMAAPLSPIAAGDQAQARPTRYGAFNLFWPTLWVLMRTSFSHAQCVRWWRGRVGVSEIVSSPNSAGSWSFTSSGSTFSFSLTFGGRGAALPWWLGRGSDPGL